MFRAVSYKRPRAVTDVDGGVIWPGVADNWRPNFSTSSMKELNKKVAWTWGATPIESSTYGSI